MANGNEILAPETVEAIKTCVHEAVDRHGFDIVREMKAQGLTDEKLSDPYRARLVFDGLLRIINWTNPKEVAPLVPVFESAYAESPRYGNSIHSLVDSRLARDGFEIKEGRLLKLAI